MRILICLYVHMLLDCMPLVMSKVSRVVHVS